MIIEFLLVMYLGALVAFILAQRGRYSVITAAILGGLASLWSSIFLQPINNWEIDYILGILVRRALIFVPFSLLAAHLGHWTKDKRTTK